MVWYQLPLNNTTFKRITVDQGAEIERLRDEFKNTSAMCIEQTICEWCAIWRVFHDNGKFLDKLPTMP